MAKEKKYSMLMIFSHIIVSFSLDQFGNAHPIIFDML